MTSPLLHAARPILRELAPTLVFIAIVSLTGNVMAATAVGAGLGVVSVGWTLARRRPVEALQWLGLVLVLVLGGATLVTHDPRFIMAKPTFVFTAVGATMLKPGWQRPYVPPIALPHLGHGVIVAWGYVWAALMFAIAGVSAALAVAGALPAWSIFNAYVPMGAMIGLFALQYLTLRRAVVRARRAAGTGSV